MGVQWQPWVSGQEIPSNAISAGCKEPDGTPLYIARCEVEGGVHPGKIGATTGRGILCGYAGKEHYEGRGEVLVGDESSVRWVDCNGPKADGQGAEPVDGGHDGQGNKLWVAQIERDGSATPGKVGWSMNGATIAFGGTEYNDGMTYKLLVLA